MNKSIKITRCFACWSGHRCKTKSRIPRKSKKRYKQFLRYVYQYLDPTNFDYVSTCDIAESYQRHKKLFFLVEWLHKYQQGFQILINYAEDMVEAFAIDDKGRLCWTWEDDNGLYTYGGLLPFAYSKEQSKGTWSFNEVCSLIQYFVGDDTVEEYHLSFGESEAYFPKFIKSDRDLLKFLSKNKKEVPND